MKFLYFLATLLLLLLLANFEPCSATSPPACGYTAIDGHLKLLSYFPGIQKGEEYIDYGGNASGICVQRAVCLVTYETKVDKCADLDVNCADQNADKAEFPACCAKC